MAVTLNGTTGLVFNDGSAQDTAATGFGFKNRIINGAMVIDQRNAGASVTQTSSYPYTLDRWQCGGSVSSKFTVQQSSTAPTGFVNSSLITSSSAYTVGAGENFVFFQNIEGYNTADLMWGTANAQTVTLSFWVRSSLTGTFGGSIQNSATNRSYPFTYTISTANTFEYKTITIAGDTSGTWLTTNGIGIIVRYGLGVGSTGSGTAGAWAGTNYLSATGATSVVGTSGATWYVTGVQLEKGSTATSFDYRPYGTELALCQRYFESSMTVAPADNMSVASTGVYAMSTSGATPVITYAFKVTKRSDPTLTYYAPATTSPSGKVREDATGTIRNVTGGGTTNWGAIIGVTSGAATVSYQFGYHASAEL
jgi:hypothetical protein